MDQMPFNFQAPESQVAEADEAESTEPKVFSVSEINKAIRGLLEGQFNLVWIRGEISNFKAHTSGHHYFSLKDNTAQISAVMFKGHNQRLKFRPHDGLEVLVRGKISVYEARGNYQIICELMEPVGAGALQKAFEQLKAKLQKEGLFDQARKRPLPAFPKHVAVVTSPTGAAIRDILNILRRRYRGLRVTLIPALVQGDQAAVSIVEGIRRANLLKDVDVLIVGRGGGSVEDMWCFNEESVARAIVASRIPTISAVGHEVDFTIADFVADLRAPTPSAAAELVVKSTAEVVERIGLLQRQLRQCMTQYLNLQKRHWSLITKRLVDPRRKLQDGILRCDELSARLQAAVERFLIERRTAVDLAVHRMGSPREALLRLQQRLAHGSKSLGRSIQILLQAQGEQLAKMAALLDSFSPLKVVERGYSIVSKGSEVIKSVSQVKKGEKVELRFAQGRAKAEIVDVFEK